MRSRYAFVLLCLLAGGGAACEPHDGMTTMAVTQSPVAHVDSILPIEEEVRRFSAGLETVTALRGGAASRDELVGLFIAALEQRDTAALRGLALTPAEFIHLWYPHTHFTARPYELSPQLLWFQLENHGSKGLRRALDRFGGRTLGYTGHECAADVADGPNRIHRGCVLHLRESDRTAADVILFGAVIERAGAWKFINYANPL